MVIVIAESHRYFLDWCRENDELPNDRKFAVLVPGGFRAWSHGRHRQDGDSVKIVGHDFPARFRDDVALSLIPCGFTEAEREDGSMFQLRLWISDLR